MDRLRIPSESRYAPMIGFSKAVRAGQLVFLAGITAVDAQGGVTGGDDPYAQARACFAKITVALSDAGASTDDVVHTRMYLIEAAHWEAVGRAHGETFADAPPAATMLVVKELLDPRMLVEIEVTAVVEDTMDAVPGPQQ
jgi:enamine deaminase RidA (YjgF/YER057c/UK114 family)